MGRGILTGQEDAMCWIWNHVVVVVFDEWIIFRESSMSVILFPFLSNIRSILVTSCAPRKRITKNLAMMDQNLFVRRWELV